METITYKNVVDGRVRELAVGTAQEQAHANAQHWEKVDSADDDVSLSDLTVEQLDAIIDAEDLDVAKSLAKADKVAAIEDARG